jgi:hypothetical protein
VRAKKEEAAAANNSQRDEARNRWLNTAAEPPQPVAPPEPPKVPPPPEPSIFQVATQSLTFAVDPLLWNRNRNLRNSNFLTSGTGTVTC